jgi:hypothetical protein
MRILSAGGQGVHIVRTRLGRNAKASQDSEQIFRYWVEVRELGSGPMRNLPLGAVAKIHIPRTKTEPQRPREDVLQLKDGSTTLEARSLDDLAAQLRQRYALHRERHREAEQRRAAAINNLIEIPVDAVMGSAR